MKNRFLTSGLLLACGCGGPYADLSSATTSASTLIEEWVDSPALQGNLLGEPTQRKILVYLPPGFNASGKTKYRTVYLLSGLGGDHRNFAIDGTPNRIAQMRGMTLGLDF